MVTVLTDSVACLPAELAERLGIGVVGIPMTLDGTRYRDGVDLTAEEFYVRMGDDVSHQTAAPSVGDWLDAMQQAVDRGADALLVVTLPARLSSTCGGARAAARMVDVPAVVIDAQTVAAAEGLYVRRLAEEALGGAPLEELSRRAERRRGCYRLEFVLDGLQRLSRTGRMPSAVARFGDAIDVKPILTLSPGAEIRPMRRTCSVGTPADCHRCATRVPVARRM